MKKKLTLMNNYNSWVLTRDLYKKWLSKFILDNLNNKVFIYKNFNILYITYLAKQDNETRNQWLKKIHFRLNGAKYEYKKFNNIIYFIFRFLTSFLHEIVKLLLIKYSFKNSNYRKEKNTIYFHSLSSNLRINDGVCYDRHFSNSPNLDSKYNLKTVHLITLIPSFNELFKFSTYIKEINNKLKLLEKKYIILNHYISFKNLFLIYFSIFKKWFLFRKETGKLLKNKAFVINKIDFDDILLRELEKSFFGEIQLGLLYGKSFGNFFTKISKKNIVITYGETLSSIRPVYHFSNKIKNKVKFISIQHAVNHKNKMSSHHKKNDFIKSNKYNYSLIPDYYLLHGSQSKNITTDFYPKSRIKIIGCLKYDDFPTRRKISDSIKKRVYNLIGKKNKKVLLITPSLNDYKDLISVFYNVNILSEWRIILSLHPATSLKEVNRFLAKLKLKNKIEIFKEIKTVDLFYVSNLILCGYSSSIYEALSLGKDGIQFSEMKNPPIFDSDNKIPFVQNKNDFWKWFKNYNITSNFNLKVESNYIEKKYFHKLDGNAAERLWKFIYKIKSI